MFVTFLVHFYSNFKSNLCKQTVENLSRHCILLIESVINKRITTIHHERPCRIEISHPRGRKFNQGRGLPSPWLNSDPEGEISLSYMDRFMVDRFSPAFRKGFCQNIKTP